MEHPERPSRHRGPDKWKRIIEPAGDSDSSEWSSDSDVGIGVGSFQYRRHDPAAGSSSSSNNVRDQQQSPVSTNTNGSGQNKQPRDTTSSVFHPLDSYNFMFDPIVGTKRYERLEPGAFPHPPNFNHLLHHDYAEREVNSDRGNGDSHLFHTSILSPLIGLGPKRRWLLDSRSDSGSVTAIDCSTTTSAPSTSTCGSTTAVMSDEPMAQDPDSGNNTSASTTINTPESPDEDRRWRILTASRGILNYSPPRKRALFDPAIGPLLIPSSDSGNSVTAGCDVTMQGSSVHTLTQSQAGQSDCTVTSATLDSVRHAVPRIFKPPHAVKDLRLNKPPGSSSRESCAFPYEDFNNTPPRASDETPEIQVLSMAGPSNRSSAILYHSGAPPRVQLTLQESTVPEESQKMTQGLVGLLEAEDEGVEVIMVDESQSDPTAEKPQNVSPDLKQQSQSQPQEITNQEQQAKEDDESIRCSQLQRMEDKLLNRGLIELLECPVCMEYMGPPIHQCRRGHLVCSTCKPKLPSCPSCRSRFTESRNLAMEKVADKLYYPCKNAHVGCSTILRLRDKDEHEANCVYRSYRCIMVPPCEWKGQHGEILDHVKIAHANTLLLGSEHVLEMHLGNFTEQSSQNWIVSTLGELFRVNLGAVRGGRVQVFGCVLLLGPARHAPLYRYTLTVGPTEGDTAQRKMSYSRTTHCYVERCSVYYSAGDSFHLRTEAAQLFSTGPCNDRVMCVKLRIDKIES